MEHTSLAWAAGILEGEGSVHIASQKRTGKDFHTFVLVLVVAMCDRDVVVEFARATLPDTGTRVVERGARKEGRKRLYMWQVTSQQAAAALRRLQPYVRGIRMQKRIEFALEFQAQKRIGNETHTVDYSDLQRVYYERMKAMNIKGAQNPLYLLAQDQDQLT